jgi:hypothetical protein
MSYKRIRRFFVSLDPSSSIPSTERENVWSTHDSRSLAIGIGGSLVTVRNEEKGHRNVCESTLVRDNNPPLTQTEKLVVFGKVEEREQDTMVMCN